MQAKLEIANRLFFRLYQCANMLHKTGTRAVEKEGLTTQQWAVLGALSRKGAEGGMTVGDMATYLKVSRQNLSGLIGRMERDKHIELVADTQDRRAKRVRMTANGRRVWENEAQPKIRAYYEGL
jgi:DNA-binding MarR family transcriptional regulator